MTDKRFDIEIFGKGLEETFPEILFAFLFGSAQRGIIKTGSDVDLAIYINETSEKKDLIARVLEFINLREVP